MSTKYSTNKSCYSRRDQKLQVEKMVEGQEMGRERPHEGPLQMEKRVATTGRARDQWGVRRVAPKGSQ